MAQKESRQFLYGRVELVVRIPSIGRKILLSQYMKILRLSLLITN